MGTSLGRALRHHARAVEHVFCWANVGGMPDALAQRHVELFVTEVAPALGARGASVQD